MTEAPNLPEREQGELTGGEGKAARVTHIRSRGFTPRAPEEITLGTLTPASNRIESIIAPSVIAEEAVPAYALQEPALEHREKKGIPLKAKLAGVAATLAVTAAGVFGYNKINSSDDEAQVIIPSAPTQVIPTPENLKLTPEATKEPAKVEKSPYNFAIQKTVGDVSLSIEDKLLTRTECPDPTVSSKNATLVPCDPIRDIIINRDEFPNVDKNINEAGKMGFYYAWKSQDDSRKDITYEKYKTKLENGEDLSFKTWGFQGESFLPTDIVINPTDKIHIDWIAEPVSIFKPFTSFGVGYRKINDEFHIELFNYLPPNGAQKQITRNYPAGNIRSALSYLSFYEMLKKGTMAQSDQGFSLSISNIIGSNLSRKNPDGTSFYSLNIE